MYQIIKNITDNQYIKSLIAIVAIVIALLAWFYPRSTEIKNIKVGLITNIQPINISDSIKKEDFVLLYKEKKINNLNYLKFQIKNNGSIPLIKEDFKQDIEIIFPETAELINYEIKPLILNVTKKEKNILSFNSELLNPNDAVELVVLLDNNGELINPNNIILNGRVVGIKNLALKNFKEDEILSDDEKRISARNDIKKGAFAILLLIGITGPIIVFIYFLDYKGENKYFKFFSKVCMLGAYLFGFSLVIFILYVIGRLIYRAI